MKKTFEFIACIILIAQFLIIDFRLIQAYQQNSDIILIVISAVMTLLLLFYFLRYMVFPSAIAWKVIFSHFFLSYWTVLLIGFSILLIFISLLRYLVHEQIPMRFLIFLVIWIINVSIVISGIFRRVKFLKGTEIYQIVDKRIRRAGFEIRFSYSGAHRFSSDSGRIKKLNLSNIHWFIGPNVIFMALALFLLTVVVISLVKGKVNSFLIVPFLFGAISMIVSVRGFLRLIEAISGKSVRPTFIKRIREPTFLSKPLFAGKETFVYLFIFILVVLFGFSMGALMYAIGDWKIGQFIIAIACPFIGFRVITTLGLEESQKEKRKRRPTCDIKTIEGVQKGLLVIGHFFGYCVIITGLIIIHQLGGNRFTLELPIVEAQLPWVSVLWAWLVLSELLLFHQGTKDFYPQGWTPPRLISLTMAISIPFEKLPTLNFFKLLFKLVDLLLSVIFRLLGIKFEKTVKEGACTLRDAQSLAEPIARERDSEAYLFALQSGEEGITAENCCSNEWKFSYYLPKKRRQLDIVIAEGKGKAKKSMPFSEPPSEKITEEQIDPIPVIKAVQQALRTIFEEMEKEAYIFFLYLPSARFSEIAGEEGPPPERPCWLVSVFDKDMSFVENFYVDMTTYQVWSKEDTSNLTGEDDPNLTS